jgi:hypothetical protein
MAWDLTALEHQLKAALDQFDWAGADAVCKAIVDKLPTEPELFPEDAAKRILQRLRRRRRFAAMGTLAEALTLSGLQTPQMRRQYAQALIEQGRFGTAELVLRRLLPDTATKAGEQAEVRGLLGRVYKQRYVTEGGAGYLQRAFDEYSTAYADNPGVNTWHAINMVALVARAAADRVPLTGTVDYKALAQTILTVIAAKEEAATKGLEAFDLATRMEAYVALGDCQEAEKTAMIYSDADDADSFEFASTLRQLKEVWRLTDAHPCGDVVLPILRAAQLKKEGGGMTVPLAEAKHDLEKVFGSDKSQSLIWYRTGLERGKSVCRVETADGKGFGTGWLVKSSDFFPQLQPARLLVLTNAHVCSTTYVKAIKPPDAWVNFQMLGQRMQMKSIVWSSPVPELDATFLDFAEPLTGKPMSLYPSPMQMAEPGPRMYIIGHPGGRDLEFSLNDNRLIACKAEKLHYRTPTEGGSSGSPIFDPLGWQVVGLHHAWKEDLPMLDGSGKCYNANEGIAILSIQQRTVMVSLPSTQPPTPTVVAPKQQA